MSEGDPAKDRVWQRGPDPRGSFWSWQKLMYRFLDRIGPEEIAAIAAFAQMQMLDAGFAAVVEFHYLHHGPGGAPCDNLAELSQRIVSAEGIGLTLMPALYQRGGRDGQAPSPRSYAEEAARSRAKATMRDDRFSGSHRKRLACRSRMAQCMTTAPVSEKVEMRRRSRDAPAFGNGGLRDGAYTESGSLHHLRADRDGRHHGPL